MLTYVDTFSGAGVTALAARWAGLRVSALCEISPFKRRVLEKNFEGVPIISDIRAVSAQSLRGVGVGRVDVYASTWPCQGISAANPDGAGLADARSGLWYESLRVIRETRPVYVLLENSANLRTRGADAVLAGLESEGYTCGAFVVGAWAAGAWHKRERVFVMAHAPRERQEREPVRRHGALSDAGGATGRGADHGGGEALLCGRQRWQDGPRPCGVADGVADRLDRLKCLGEGLVPQVVYPFFKAIMDWEAQA